MWSNYAECKCAAVARHSISSHQRRGVASWSYSWLLNFHKTKMSAFTDRTLLNKISWALFLLELIFWVKKISCMSIHTRVYFWHWSSILITCAVFFFKRNLTIQCYHIYCASFVKRFLSGFWLSNVVLATDDTKNKKMIACPWWQCLRCCLQNDWYEKEKECGCMYLEQLSPGRWEIAVWH